MLLIRKKFIKSCFLDLITLTIITYGFLEFYFYIENTVSINIVIVIGGLLFYSVYFTFIRPLMYILSVKNCRDVNLEKDLMLKFNVKVKIYLSNNLDNILIMPNKKHVLIGDSIFSYLSNEDIYNIILLSILKNKFSRIVQFIALLVPIILFYYAFESSDETIRAILLVSGGALIYPLKRFTPIVLNRMLFKSKKIDLNKNELTNSVVRYYDFLGKGKHIIQKSIFSVKKQELLNVINKI